MTGVSTSITLGIPPGLTGTYSVSVTAVEAWIEGAPSTPVAFTLGGGCTLPSTPANLSGYMTDGQATVSWTASPGAMSYVLQAGTAPGASDLFSGNIGPITSVSASGLPQGFRAFVRVVAINACGQSSGPTADILVQ